MELNILFFHGDNVSQLSRKMFVVSTTVYELSQYPCLFPCSHLSLFLYFLVITWFADFRMLHFAAHTNFYMSQLLTFSWYDHALLHSQGEGEERLPCKQHEYVLFELHHTHTHKSPVNTKQRTNTNTNWISTKYLHRWYVVPKGYFPLLQ